MNCDLAHERIVAAAYGELADEQTHELERHLADCAECRQERDEVRALRQLADAYPMIDPDPNLVARSRQRLEEALDTLPPKRWYERLNQWFGNNRASLEAAPIAASLLLIAGMSAGVAGGYEYAQLRAAHAAQLAARTQAALSAQAGPVEVSNVSSVVRQPDSGMVEVHYNQVVPQRIQGTMDNPKIRQLLMMASEDPASPGVRDDSVGVLAEECKNGRGCQQGGMRDALMVALRYDGDERVRAKALHGLEPYVAEDMRVRDAVLEALMNDDDSRIRNAAIGILEPVDADTSVRQVLSNVANTDRNPHIRNASRQILRRVTEIQ
jgi:anti-sigma factor RsiW